MNSSIKHSEKRFIRICRFSHRSVHSFFEGVDFGELYFFHLVKPFLFRLWADIWPFMEYVVDYKENSYFGCRLIQISEISIFIEIYIEISIQIPASYKFLSRFKLKHHHMVINRQIVLAGLKVQTKFCFFFHKCQSKATNCN